MNTRTALSLLLAAGLALPALAQDKAAAPAPAAQAPEAAAGARIDVVFVLDTTGSMSGLIDGAKQKIWSVANAMATAKPRPTIRIGLVGYRDKGDDYITKLTALTDDLDTVYGDLMKFKAAGGGDGPESVNQALSEAVAGFEWNQDKNTLRLIYLVGDAPPHMDYDQDIKYPATCERAAKAGIIINTIQCGGDSSVTPIWQEIARKAEGEYFAIEQSGGMAAIATPFDAELVALGVQLEGTVEACGTREEQVLQVEKAATASALSESSAPTEAKADRAMYKAGPAGGASLGGARDLVRDAAEKKVKLSEIPVEHLSPEMQAMTPPEREAYLAKKIQEREACLVRINELGQKRQAFIQEKLATAGGEKNSFDALVLESLMRQGSKCGITYPAGDK